MTSPTAACAACHDALVLRVNPHEEGGQMVPDDLRLPCGCHYHWQCLIDEASEVAISLKCPTCQTYLPSNEPGPSVTNPIQHVSQGVTIPTQYHSEGGVQENYDILPILTEEAYLETHPEAVLTRALHMMCAQGDTVGILDLIRGAVEDEEAMGVVDLLRQQDPQNGMKSGLHIAIDENQFEVFYLLLYLASAAPVTDFPPGIACSAEQLGLDRPDKRLDTDIRELKDDRGHSAEDYAHNSNDRWKCLAESGILDPTNR